MKYIVTAEEMKKYDQNTIERIGVPGIVLMERAALKAFELLKERFGEAGLRGADAYVLAGIGNNGGDGLALARLLADAGCSVDVRIVGDVNKATDSFKIQRAILDSYPVTIVSGPRMKKYDILADALFGVGLTRDVAGVCAEAVEEFNNCAGYKLAIDIPSGISADNGRILGCAAVCDATVTFGFVKRGLFLYPGCDCAGEVTCAAMGIDERSFYGEEPGMFFYDEKPGDLLPDREASGNKGTFGKVLCIAGSYNMAGAACLASKSAYRTGAGMVKVLSAPENREIIQKTVPEALLGTYEDLEASLKWADVIVAGPGLSTSEEAFKCVKKALVCSDLPLVIDADGLNLLAGSEELREDLKAACRAGRSVILTPHVGELARLTGKAIAELKKDLAGAAGELAAELGCVVAAKDARTVTCAPDGRICMNIRGNSGMATAGSGDVLAGVIGALLASGMSAFEAASKGVVLHACAGDIAAAELGEHGCMAGDIAEALAKIWR